MIFSHGQDYHRQYEPVMFGWKEGKSHFRNKMYANFKDVINLDFTDYQEMFDVWYERRDVTSNYIHPTQKPVRLAERALKKHSEFGDIVVDLFSGSASTLMGCQGGGDDVTRLIWILSMSMRVLSDLCDFILIFLLNV